jgi:hypothetical protein
MAPIVTSRERGKVPRALTTNRAASGPASTAKVAAKAGSRPVPADSYNGYGYQAPSIGARMPAATAAPSAR